MTNHPNRSKNTPSSARNPKPREILEARLAANLTQTQAAEMIHSTLRTWQDWEAGIARMHPGLWELFLTKLETMHEDAELAELYRDFRERFQNSPLGRSSRK